MLMKKEFEVYHPKAGMNILASLDFGAYQKVATVEARDFENAYKKSQNDFNENYCLNNVRSTCVGDVIIDNFTSVAVIVENFGFTYVKVIHTETGELVIERELTEEEFYDVVGIEPPEPIYE